MLLQLPPELLEHLLNFVGVLDLFVLAFKTGDSRLGRAVRRNVRHVNINYRTFQQVPPFLPTILKSFQRLEIVQICSTYSELRPDWRFLVSLPPTLKHLRIFSSDCLRSFFIPAEFGSKGLFEIRDGVFLKEMWYSGPYMIDIGLMWPNLETLEVEGGVLDRWMPGNIAQELWKTLPPTISNVMIRDVGSPDFDPADALPSTLTELETSSWTDRNGTCFRSSFNTFTSLRRLRFSGFRFQSVFSSDAQKNERMGPSLFPSSLHEIRGSQHYLFDQDSTPATARCLLSQGIRTVTIDDEMVHLEWLESLPSSVTSLDVLDDTFADVDFAHLPSDLDHLAITVGLPLRHFNWPNVLKSLRIRLVHTLPFGPLLQSLPANTLTKLDLRLPTPINDVIVQNLPRTVLKDLRLRWNPPGNYPYTKFSHNPDCIFPPLLTYLELDGGSGFDIPKLIPLLPPKLNQLHFPAKSMLEKYLGLLPPLADFTCGRLLLDGSHLPPSETEVSVRTIFNSLAPILQRVTSKQLRISSDKSFLEDGAAWPDNAFITAEMQITIGSFQEKIEILELPSSMEFHSIITSSARTLRRLVLTGSYHLPFDVTTYLGDAPELETLIAPHWTPNEASKVPASLTELNIMELLPALALFEKFRQLLILRVEKMPGSSISSTEVQWYFPPSLTRLTIVKVTQSPSSSFLSLLPATLSELRLPASAFQIRLLTALRGRLSILEANSLDMDSFTRVFGDQPKIKDNTTEKALKKALQNTSFNQLALRSLKRVLGSSIILSGYSSDQLDDIREISSQEVPFDRYKVKDLFFDNLLDSHLSWMICGPITRLNIDGTSARHLTTSCFVHLPPTLVEISLGRSQDANLSRNFWSSSRAFSFLAEDDELAASNVAHLPTSLTALHFLTRAIGPRFIESLSSRLPELTDLSVAIQQLELESQQQARTRTASGYGTKDPSPQKGIHLIWPRTVLALVIHCEVFGKEMSNFVPPGLKKLYVYDYVGAGDVNAFELPVLEELEALSITTKPFLSLSTPYHTRPKYFVCNSDVAPYNFGHKSSPLSGSRD